MTIKELIEKGQEFVERHQFSEDLVSLDKIGLSGKDESLITMLAIASAIRKVQGTSKVYIGEGLRDKEKTNKEIEKIGFALSKIIEEIKKDSNNHLTREKVVRCIKDNGQSEDEYYQFVSILSSLDLVTSAGRSRTGGIKLYDKEQENKEIRKTEEKISKAKNKEDSKTEHEKVLYPSASKEISDYGFQALIIGSNRRLPGEWNTPDVVGYKIKRHKILGGAEIELVTIEVKWEISKLAIAETNSHQRLSNKSFLMVHQTYDEIESTYLEDIIEKGIGLICKVEDGHKIIIPARENNPDNSQVDNFLDLILEHDEKAELRKEMARHFFNDYYKPLFP